jgi:hypothetical protein
MFTSFSSSGAGRCGLPGDCSCRWPETKRQTCSCKQIPCFLRRGRLHVYDSVYESPHNSVQELHTMGLMVSIIPRTPTITVCWHISGNVSWKLICKQPCAENRTQNRTDISSAESHTCRRPLTICSWLKFLITRSRYEKSCKIETRLCIRDWYKFCKNQARSKTLANLCFMTHENRMVIGQWKCT